MAIAQTTMAPLLAASLIVVLISGCGSDQPPVVEAEFPAAGSAALITLIPNPAAPDSAQASLLATSDLSLLMSWVEASDGVSVLRFARWQGGRWSAVRDIARGANWFVNWADFPAMAEDGNGDLYGHWLEKEGDSTYAYGVRLTSSGDSGISWSDPLTPHGDGTLSEHGFVSYFKQGDGVLGLAWLDGRNTGGGGHAGQGGGAMTLRSGLVSDNRVDEQELDASVCDCCQTDAVATPSGAVVVYRDRDAEENRDIGIVRRIDGQWQAPGLVARDGWQIAACPVNGPAVAARDQGVAVAWFTMAGGEPAVKLAISHDQGASFDQPLRIDPGQALGRVDLGWLASGDLVVSWLEDRGETAMLRMARVREGQVASRDDIGATAPVRSSGFPRLAVIGSRVFITWREMDDEGATLRLAEVSYPDPSTETGP